MKQENKNFDKHYPIWKACGDDNIRVSMHYVKFENGYAYATDSHILVKARLSDISNFDEQELSLLEGKFILGNNLKKIVKSKGVVTIKEDAIVVEEENCVISYPLKTSHVIRFPDCERAMVGSEVKALKKEFGIYAEYLSVLSEVMYSYNGVQMEWKSDYMFMVRPIGGHKDIRGVIMTKVI